MTAPTIAVVSDIPDPSTLITYTADRISCRVCGASTTIPKTAIIPAEVVSIDLRHRPHCPVLRYSYLNARGRGNSKGARRALRHAVALAQLRSGKAS